MTAPVHERLAQTLAGQTTLRLLEPPMPLRRRILSLLAELDEATGPDLPSGLSRTSTRHND